MAASSTWTPSAISSAVTWGEVSTAPMTPVSRWVKGRMALKTCVAWRAPRSMAAIACGVSRVGVAERNYASCFAQAAAIRSSAPGSSGASVRMRAAPAAACRNFSNRSTEGGAIHSGG